MCGSAWGRVVIVGVGDAQHKISDRIQTVAEHTRRLGYRDLRGQAQLGACCSECAPTLPVYRAHATTWRCPLTGALPRTPILLHLHNLVAEPGFELIEMVLPSNGFLTLYWQQRTGCIPLSTSHEAHVPALH